MRILSLDTATEACSAAVWIDGHVRHRVVEAAARSHAELILGMVDELLAESGWVLRSFDAIAFGRGPGSFTGVRLAASIAQGLAFGACLRVVAVSDLLAVAQRTLGLLDASRDPLRGSPDESTHSHRGSPDWGRSSLRGSLDGSNGSPPGSLRVLVCNDARMREVYWGCFSLGAQGLMEAAGPERVSKPEDVAVPGDWDSHTCVAAGRGFVVYPALTQMGGGFAQVFPDVLPGAAEIAVLAAPEVRAGRVLSAEDALPVYLRDDVARPSAT